MRRLTTAKTRELRDHVPQFASLFVGFQERYANSTAPKVDRDAMMACLETGKNRQQFLDNLEKHAEQITDDQLRTWRSHSSPDFSTQALVNCIKQSMCETFPPEVKKNEAYKEERAKQKELLKQRWLLKEQLATGDLVMTQLLLTMATRRAKYFDSRPSPK